MGVVGWGGQNGYAFAFILFVFEKGIVTTFDVVVFIFLRFFEVFSTATRVSGVFATIRFT